MNTCEMYYCLYNNIARGIGLLDKITIFVCSCKFFIQVRAFEIGVPLKVTMIIALLAVSQIATKIQMNYILKTDI